MLLTAVARKKMWPRLLFYARHSSGVSRISCSLPGEEAPVSNIGRQRFLFCFHRVLDFLISILMIFNVHVNDNNIINTNDIYEF